MNKADPSGPPQRINTEELLDATKKVDKDPEIHIGNREYKAMKRNGYNEKKKDLDTSYVIQHKRTGQVVEIKAISAIMAANTVGWRPRHIKVLKVKKEE